MPDVGFHIANVRFAARWVVAAVNLSQYGNQISFAAVPGGAMAKDTDVGNGRLPGSVQSIARAFDLLETMADLGGIVGLSQLASRSGLPLPTIHRLMRTLLDLGYV